MQSSDTINKEWLMSALSCTDFSSYKAKAMELRRVHFGNRVTLRAIIEYSNHCKRLCKYCGLNAANKTLKRYRMSPESVMSAASEAINVGYKSIVLQGGEDSHYDAAVLGAIVQKIAQQAVITLSAGEMSEEEYSELFNCGATRYLLKHETANAEIYRNLHSDSTLEQRLNCIRNLKKIGYAAGSGFMVGLPNQSIADIADDILLCRELDVDMAGIGTFIPQQDTPLAHHSRGDAQLTLRAIALLRIVMPHINIPATTSLGVVSGDPYIALDYGADVIMRKVTPTQYRALYAIYTANARQTDIAAERAEIEYAVTARGYSAY